MAVTGYLIVFTSTHHTRTGDHQVGTCPNILVWSLPSLCLLSNTSTQESSFRPKEQWQTMVKNQMTSHAPRDHRRTYTKFHNCFTTRARSHHIKLFEHQSLSLHSTLCLKKTSHLWLAITLMHVNGFWYFFGRNVTDKVGNQKMLYYATSNSEQCTVSRV